MWGVGARSGPGLVNRLKFWRPMLKKPANWVLYTIEVNGDFQKSRSDYYSQYITRLRYSQLRPGMHVKLDYNAFFIFN